MAETKGKKQEWVSTGRRKKSVARVRLRDGTGKITINDRELNDYFTEDRDRGLIVAPLELTEMRSRLDVFVKVQGGGYTGQAGAICQGVARALKEMFFPKEAADALAAAAAAAAPGEAPAAPVAGAITKKLRDSGYLTRDDRMKERKHYGLKGARKAFQFSKR
ncbi:30S ribosomal protein S9 [Planctomycetaceae bacterium SCGC AG-212-F19]|nr:30S ribosomal protein S9 [Planctomycetaceae bacterium SCGC AG-212-F19]